jgi:septal ring factor EnvC (AmiA/AmiB activator)
MISEESLRGNLVLNEFIESLYLSQPSTSPFLLSSSKSYVKHFETSIESLQKLRRRTIRKIDDTSDAIDASEDSTNKRLEEINEKFKSVKNGVANLEGQIGQVANTAVKIGQQLENIDNQMTRAIEAQELVQYFLEFSKGQSVCLLFNAIDAVGDFKEKESRGGIQGRNYSKEAGCNQQGDRGLWRDRDRTKKYRTLL